MILDMYFWYPYIVMVLSKTRSSLKSLFLQISLSFLVVKKLLLPCGLYHYYPPPPYFFCSGLLIVFTKKHSLK